MPDYEKLYHLLFHSITDTIEDLKAIQIKAEEMYIEECEKEESACTATERNPLNDNL